MKAWIMYALAVVLDDLHLGISALGIDSFEECNF